jgi:alcohol dehydrogenase
MTIYTIYNIPPVLFGPGSSAQTGTKLKELGCSRVFCVYDSGIKAAGIIDPVIKSLKASGIEAVHYDGVQADPSISRVEEAGRIARDAGVDGIIGIGGGSSMDTAKGVNVMIANPGPLKNYMGLDKFGARQETGKPLILMPTTAGTSSEVSRAYTLTDEATGQKMPGGGINATATLAIVDPELTIKLPKPVTALTGIDALCHGAEALTNPNDNPAAVMAGVEGVRIAFENLPRAYENGSDLEARTNMSFACVIIGYAFMNNGTHIGHAVADAISKLYHPPHGVGVAIGLPFLARYCNIYRPAKVRKLAEAIGLKPRSNISTEILGKRTADALRSLARRIGIVDMKSLGIKPSDLESLARHTVNNGRFAAPGAEKPDFEVVLRLLREEYNS